MPGSWRSTCRDRGTSYARSSPIQWIGARPSRGERRPTSDGSSRRGPRDAGDRTGEGASIRTTSRLKRAVRALEADGVRFASDTDTEIVAHLVDRALRAGAPSLREAVRTALAQVEGAYAIAVVSRTEPDRLVVAKNASPLVLGIGEGETLCGSDVP